MGGRSGGDLAWAPACSAMDALLTKVRQDAKPMYMSHKSTKKMAVFTLTPDGPPNSAWNRFRR